MLCLIASSFSLFFLVVVNIVVVVRLASIDDSQILSTSNISASVVGKKRRLFEHLKRKKTTSFVRRSSDKKLRQCTAHVPKKKLRLTRASRSAAAVFFYRFFSFSLSFFSYASHRLRPDSCDDAHAHSYPLLLRCFI